ncbi:TPA: type II toxin-antitoxin system PemK/MazF family toxin [Streptococcus suis]|nr:type II toxin-antitoxin system PemK/MazF family toxin [Streptococcus suis]HEL1798102.1 type II toxin-antitoxin system PemK/MazF family toxin [Streptococcus suis]
MAKKLSTLESQNHKNQTLAELDNYLSNLIGTNEQAKADKISFWIKDWIKYLELEENFQPNKMLKYKRGNIIKVHLGFNVGSEEGGLHYAIVLDADNHLKNPVLTVAPLTSVKPHTDISKLSNDQLYIGKEVYTKLENKLKTLLDKLSAFNLSEATQEELNSFQDELTYAKRIKAEIDKMKTGSIILIGQITTISKLRIFDPRNKYGVLKGIKVSDDTLDKLDIALKQKYFKK